MEELFRGLATRVRWRMAAGVAALVVTVLMTLPVAASKFDLGQRVGEIWPNSPVSEIWPNAPAGDLWSISFEIWP